jgi:hypothetical protein
MRARGLGVEFDGGPYFESGGFEAEGQAAAA